MKTDREALAISKFCHHLQDGLRELGYRIGLTYSNVREEVIVDGMRHRTTISVLASSTKAAGRDVAKRLNEILMEES